jgi:hypothetical protein
MGKASKTAVSVAIAAAGSMLFGGVALACVHHDGEHYNGGHEGHVSYTAYYRTDDNSHGGNGHGGHATNNCLNVGVPVLSGIGAGGQGGAHGASCNASANGRGGNAY